MKNITLQTSTVQPGFNKLTIEAHVDDAGNFALKSIRLRWRRVSYGSYNTYIVYMSMNDAGRWQCNYYERLWGNGRHAAWSRDFQELGFVPALEEFANSDTMRQIADRLLKLWQRRIQNARRQLQAVAR